MKIIGCRLFVLNIIFSNIVGITIVLLDISTITRAIIELTKIKILVTSIVKCIQKLFF